MFTCCKALRRRKHATPTFSGNYRNATHTATLVHDDVVDESNLRRGRPTANATWNNQTAVLVGDFLIARAFDLLVDLNNITLLKTSQQEPVKLRKARFTASGPAPARHH